MADIANLESVAKLLPPDRREQFYLTIQKFRTVPHDDDHLLMLDAMGFVALFMKELPSEFGKLIDQAGQRLTDDQSKALGDQIREILTSSLDVPNYKDMSEMTRAIRETYQKDHQQSDRLLDSLGSMQHEVAKSSRLSPILACSFATSFVTLAIGAVAAFFWLPKLLDDPITIPKHLWPYVELQRERRLAADGYGAGSGPARGHSGAGEHRHELGEGQQPDRGHGHLGEPRRGLRVPALQKRRRRESQRGVLPGRPPEVRQRRDAVAAASERQHVPHPGDQMDHGSGR